MWKAGEEGTFPVHQTVDDWHAITSLIEFGEALGARGSVSVVRSATNRVTGEPLIIKLIDSFAFSSLDELPGYMEKCCSFAHEGLVSYLGCISANRKVFLVSRRHKANTPLFDALVESMYSERQAQELLQQVCEAISVLRTQGLCHNNLKPENVLMQKQEDGDISIALTDYALTPFVSRSNLSESLSQEDYIFCSPEQLLNENFELSEEERVKTDIWSIGVLAYIILGGYHPFQDENDNAAVTMRNIRRAKLQFHEESWNEVSDAAKEFVKCCLKASPSDRVSLDDLLQHEWLTTLLPEDTILKSSSLRLHATAKSRWARTIRKITMISSLTESFYVKQGVASSAADKAKPQLQRGLSGLEDIREVSDTVSDAGGDPDHTNAISSAAEQPLVSNSSAHEPTKANSNRTALDQTTDPQRTTSVVVKQSNSCGCCVM